jgi:hypothetical protein
VVEGSKRSRGKMTPEQFERLLNILASLARGLEGNPWRDLLYVLVGALAAILGGIIGGLVQGKAWYHYEQKRATAEKRERWIQITRDWAATGRKESLREADLRGAKLEKVDLGPGKERDDGADLSYADMSEANLYLGILKRASLKYANLQGATLHWAILPEADLWRADLRRAELPEADLNGAKLGLADIRGAIFWDADLEGAELSGAKYNDATKWPNEEFTPPPDAVYVPDRPGFLFWKSKRH